MGSVASESRHVSIGIERDATSVYLYASEPQNLPEWAAGLAGTIEYTDGEWVSESPMGRVKIEFAEANKFGVLDHWVTTETDEFYNPLRVIPDGLACEVLFTVRRQAGMSDDAFEADVAAITADLHALKRVLES